MRMTYSAPSKTSHKEGAVRKDLFKKTVSGFKVGSVLMTSPRRQLVYSIGHVHQRASVKIGYELHSQKSKSLLSSKGTPMKCSAITSLNSLSTRAPTT